MAEKKVANPVIVAEFERLLKGGLSKSESFRKLYDSKFEISDIARSCDSHYSFVYGVISSSREIVESTVESKSDIIRRMAKDGQTAGNIAKVLNSNYSFVFSVVKKWKLEQLSK